MNSNKEHWILCPACGSKTRARLLPDTVLRSFPLFCPKCRRESIPTIIGCIGAFLILLAAIATPIVKTQQMRQF